MEKIKNKKLLKKDFQENILFLSFCYFGKWGFLWKGFIGFLFKENQNLKLFLEIKGKFHGYFGEKIWSLFSREWKVPWTFEKWKSILKDKSFVNFGKMLLRDKNFQRFFHNILHTMNFGVRFVSLKSRHPGLPFEYTKVS